MRPRPKPTAAQAITLTRRKPGHTKPDPAPARVSWWIGLSREALQEHARAQAFDPRFSIRRGEE